MEQLRLLICLEEYVELPEVELLQCLPDDLEWRSLER